MRASIFLTDLEGGNEIREICREKELGVGLVRYRLNQLDID